MNMNKVAVIVPVYNVREYLERCVDSLLHQKYEESTIYLIDDGSTDGSSILCDEFAKHNSNIITIHQENRGLSGARNTGIHAAIATGDFAWITFIDSDDWVDENYLSLLVKANLENDTRISVCSYTRDPNQILIPKAGSTWLIDPIDLITKYQVEGTVAWGKLYDIAMFSNVEYPLGKLHEDEFVTYKLLDACKKISFVELPLYYYFLNQAGIMKSKWNTKRLDSLTAFEEQIEYSKVTHNKLLLCHSVNKYHNGLAAQYSNVFNSSLSSKIKKSILSNLQDKLRTSLIINHKITPLIIQNVWIYEVAFPGLMKTVYWPCKKLLKDINKLTNKIIDKNNPVNNHFRVIKNKILRKQLKNKDFSLLASNCNGGFILHDLQMRFNSPFINLWIKPTDFIKYLNDMDYYNSYPLSFVKSEKNYPVGRLDDITLYFQHYKSEKEALDKWNQRIQRINTNNLFIIMTDRDGCTYQDLLNFDKLPFNKVVFTHKYYPQIKSAVFVKDFQESDEVGNLYEFKSFFAGTKYYDMINYVSWFNGKDNTD